MVRSNVLAIDRLVYPFYDLHSSNESIVEFVHEYGGMESLIKFILYRDNKVNNEVQNLLINILRTMSSPSIPEAFGHNEYIRKCTDSRKVRLQGKGGISQRHNDPCRGRDGPCRQKFQGKLN